MSEIDYEIGALHKPSRKKRCGLRGKRSEAKTPKKAERRRESREACQT